MLYKLRFSIKKNQAYDVKIFNTKSGQKVMLVFIGSTNNHIIHKYKTFNSKTSY